MVLLAAGFAACSGRSNGADVDAGATPALATGAAGVQGATTSGINGAAGASTGAAGMRSAVMTSAGGVGAGGNGVAGSAGMSTGAAGVSGAGAAGAAGSAGTAGGAGGNAGSAGNAGAGGSAPHMDLGKGNGTDVILLGDSWMSNTLQIEGTGGGITPSLQQVSGQPYRNYAVQGVMLLMADSYGPAIPTQYDDAKRENPMTKTVVMTGGGNDIIQNATLQQSCMTAGDACKLLLQQESQALDALWSKMADDGVQDIVYVLYSDAAGSLDPSLQGGKGLITPPICSAGRVRCHNVMTTDLVPASGLAADGIHPLAATNDKLAMRIYDLMTSEGMRR